MAMALCRADLNASYREREGAAERRRNRAVARLVRNENGIIQERAMLSGLMKFFLMKRFPKLALFGLGAAALYRMMKGRRAY